MVKGIMTEAQKQAMVASLLQTSAGRATLAAELQQPLRKWQDYEPVGRSAFMIDRLPQGQRPYYDKDVNTPAFVIGEDAESILVQVKGESIYVPLMVISSNPEIPLAQTQDRRFDVQNRVKVKTKTEIFREEDRKIFSLFKQATTGNKVPNAPLSVEASKATVDSFSEAISLIERHGQLRCKHIYMNPSNMKIIRRLGKDYFEPSLTGELLRSGFVGNLLGAQVHTSPEIPVGEIYFTAEEEFTGVLVESIPLSVIAADIPSRLAVGFVVYERIGLALTNSHSVARLALV